MPLELIISPGAIYPANELLYMANVLMSIVTTRFVEDGIFNPENSQPLFVHAGLLAINVSELSPGHYIIKITTGNGSQQTKAFIKK